VECFIEEPADFNQFPKFRPSLPTLDFSNLECAKTLAGTCGIVAPFTFGVFNFVGDLRGLDRLLMDFMTDEPLYHEMMSYFQAELLEFHRQLTEAGIDVVGYPGNMANGTVVGPEYFRRYFFDYEKKLIDFIQSRGTHVLYHNCGDARRGAADRSPEIGAGGRSPGVHPGSVGLSGRRDALRESLRNG
jgi:hypothetical protein